MADAHEFPGADVPVEAYDPAALAAALDAGEPVTILDVRAETEYDTWRIEGENVTMANVPYFEFIEGVTDDLLSRVPEGDPVVAVCAKGGASEYVAGLLVQEGYDAVNLADGMNGWARVYLASEVTAAPGPATVIQYRRPSSGCLAYLVHEGDEAAVIDPLRAFADRYVADAADLGVELAYAIDTHVHADHFSGVRALADRTAATVVLPEPAVARGVDYDIDYETVADGDTLAVGDATIDVRHTPGHTSGMTSYLVDDGLLCTGDGLFVESVARPDLEDGDDGAPAAARQLYDTLQVLLDLPDDTVVAPAHYSGSATPSDDGTYTARLGDLADRMPALSLDRAAFVEFILADMPPRPGNFQEIIAANLGQRAVDDDEAFELELGPNNCAATREAMTGD